MAQIVKTMINIDGTILKRFRRFELIQPIADHHSFVLHVDAETIDGKDNFLFEHSKNLIGTYLTVVSELIGDDSHRLEFEGIITNISRTRYGGHSGEIILSGHSATLLLDSAPRYTSYTNQDIAAIANDILQKYPQNRLNPSIKPWNKETLGFVMCYGETEWAFLKRISALQGEWLYFERDSLKIGKQSSGDKLKLIFGANISEFNLGMNLHGAKHQSVAYDFQNSATYQSSPNDIEQKAGLNELGKVAYQASQKVFNATPQTWNNTYLNNQGALDTAVNTRAAIESSTTVKFTGVSSHPGVKPGEKIDVRGSNIYSFAKEDYGSYVITSVKHSIAENSTYSNTFEAVPDTIKVPPVAIPPVPVYEVQSAIVTDNFDKQGLGRVKVQFRWMDKGERTPWIRVAMPHAGGGKGAFFVPEIGEEVMVGFEQSSYDIKPFVIGTVYHQQASSSFSNTGNDIKAIQTRSGTQIIMNDAEGSVHIQDPSGNTWFMDGKGNINVNAPETMTLNAKNMNINVTENMNTSVGVDNSHSVGMNNSVSVGGDHSMDVAMHHTLAVAGDSMTSVTGKLMETIEGDVHSEVKQSRTEYGKGDVQISSDGMVKKHAQKQVQNNSAEKSTAF